MSTENSVKRYNLVIPTTLYEEVEALAKANHTTVVEVLRKFIRLGLVAHAVQESKDSQLIIRDGESERELLIL